MHWVTFIVKQSNKAIIETDTIQNFNPNSATAKQQANYLKNLNQKNADNVAALKQLNPNNSSISISNDTAIKSFQDTLSAVSQLFTETLQWVINPPTADIVAYISLFMPDSISFNQKASYKNESLTEAFGEIGAIAQTVDSIVNQLGDANWTNAVKTLGQGAAEALFSKNPNIFLQSSGAAVNPQTEVLFTTIDFRTFQFDFLLTPRNLKEANEIRQIIQAFKYYSSPGLDSNNNRYFLIPSVFDIMFFYNGEENLNIPKIKTCVLTTVYSDYAPSGWVTHDDGTPLQTRLTLQFQENQIVTKKDINEGLY